MMLPYATSREVCKGQVVPRSAVAIASIHIMIRIMVNGIQIGYCTVAYDHGDVPECPNTTSSGVSECPYMQN